MLGCILCKFGHAHVFCQYKYILNIRSQNLCSAGTITISSDAHSGPITSTPYTHSGQIAGLPYKHSNQITGLPHEHSGQITGLPYECSNHIRGLPYEHSSQITELPYEHSSQITGSYTEQHVCINFTSLRVPIILDYCYTSDYVCIYFLIWIWYEMSKVNSVKLCRWCHLILVTINQYFASTQLPRQFELYGRLT